MPFEFLMKQQDVPGKKKDLPKPLSDEQERAQYESRELPYAEPVQDSQPSGRLPKVEEGNTPPAPQLLPDTDSKFLKERANARDFAFKEAERAVDRALSEIDTRDPGALEPADRTPYRMRLRAASPENYAREVESILNELEPTVRGLGGEFDRRGILGGLEEAVTTYKRLQVKPQALADQGRIDAKDLPNLQSQYNAKKKAIQEIDEKLKFTSTRRQEEELLGLKNYITKESVTLRQKIERISPGSTSNPASSPDGAPATKAPTIQESAAAATPEERAERPVQKYLSALGVKEEQLLRNIAGFMQAIGIDPDDLDSTVPTQAGILRILSVLDPEQKNAAKWAQEARSGDMELKRLLEETKGRVDLRETQINNTRNEIKQLYASLNQQPFMQSWLGMLLFVMVGILPGVGGRGAARLFGLGRNRNAISAEIEDLKEHMKMLYRNYDRERDREYGLRMEAASRLSRRDERAQDRAHDFNLIAARAKAQATTGEKNAKNKEDKELLQNLRSDLQMYQGQVNEAEQELERLSNMNLMDPYALGKGKEAEASRESRKRAILNNINAYRAKVERLSQIIEKVTGTSQLLEGPEVQK